MIKSDDFISIVADVYSSSNQDEDRTHSSRQTATTEENLAEPNQECTGAG